MQFINIYIQEIGVILDSVIFEGKKSNELKVCKVNIDNHNRNLISADELYTNKPILQAIPASNKNYFFTSKQKKLDIGLLKPKFTKKLCNFNSST
ncbi:MAG: hypothetical protein ACRCXZ_07440 [Patescibacteria group bacterium]